MSVKLCIFVCNSLAAEANHVIQSRKYPDVNLMSYPSSCVGKPLSNELISSLTSKIESEYSKIIFIVSSCYNSLKDKFPLNRKVELVHFEHCFELILNKEIVYFL